jgi:hypothetical protein
VNDEIKNKLIEMYEAGRKSVNPYMVYCSDYPGFQVETMCFDKPNNKAVYIVFSSGVTYAVEFDGTIHDDGEYGMFTVKEVKKND